MKNLLYLGNQLSQSNKTPSAIDVLTGLLTNEGYSAITASNKQIKLWRLLDMLWHIVRYKKWLDYILIDTYSTQNFYYAYLCSQLCRFLKLKYIPILHGGNLPERLSKNPRLCQAIFKHAYINVTPSKYLKSQFNNYGYSNLVEIPNTIDLKMYPFNERGLVKVKLLWVRSFAEIYNPLLAIEVLKKLLDDGIDAELCMVGPDKDGSLKAAKAYAKELNIKVTFTGKLEKAAWIKLSEEYNIFINTTNFDNMPVSVIEAMALGLPVVSTNVGGLLYLIENNVDGILVNPNNAFLFVETIKKLLRDPKQTHTLINNARKKAEQFNWEIVKNQWNKILI